MLKELEKEFEDDPAAYQDVVKELTNEYPDHLPLLTAVLAGLVALPADKRKDRLQASSPVEPYASLCRCFQHWQLCESPAGWFHRVLIYASLQH